MMRMNYIGRSCLLALPVALFLLHHYFYHSPDLHPTGFTVDENVLYMSYAHQYTDAGSFQLFYSNPFDGDPHSPAIYFQPVNTVLAPAVALDMDPGLCLSLFGLIMAIACIYTGLRIIRLLLPDKNSGLTGLLFTWGGGLTAFAGVTAAIIFPSHAYPSWLDNIFIADPANGWWGLNWGRNMFIPLEAFYHFLFLLNIYFMLRRKWMASLATALFLSLSHPFTGIAFLLVATTWAFLEKVFFQKKELPLWYAGGLLLVTIFHMWYYLVWLNQFAEHRKLFSQYSAGWTYSLLVAIPAYSIVLFLVIFALNRIKPTSRFLQVPHQRLFLCWAIISFLLSKHEWFMKPMQPIHFTRGYTWAGLFLLAIPGISVLIDSLRKRRWLFLLAVLLFLSDNILWTVNILRKKEKVEWEGHLTRETRQVFDYLHHSSSPRDLLIGNARLVMYMANTYSPANSWVSHPFNTPDRSVRAAEMTGFFENGKIPDAWTGRRILIVQDRLSTENTGDITRYKLIFENERYRIFTP